MILWLVLCFVSLVSAVPPTPGTPAPTGLPDSSASTVTPAPTGLPVVCRDCGAYLLDAGDITYVKTFKETYPKQRNLFGRQNVTEVMMWGPCIQTKTSRCKPMGDPWDDDFYYPGYETRSCHCPQCDLMLGWTFNSPSDQHTGHVQQIQALKIEELKSPK